MLNYIVYELQLTKTIKNGDNEILSVNCHPQLPIKRALRKHHTEALFLANLYGILLKHMLYQ